MYRKLVLLGLLSLFVTGCPATKKATTTLTFSAEDMERIKENHGNKTVETADIFSLKMEGVPIPPIGSTYKTVEKKIRSSGCTVLEKTDELILIKGRKRKKVKSGMVVINEKVHVYAYYFDNNKLSNGPIQIKEWVES